jgi:predicted  nucleic acid-binding Zn-ribbon protein
MFHKCKKCGRLVWFWQNKAAIDIRFKNGKKKILHHCLDCGMKLAEQAVEASDEKENNS